MISILTPTIKGREWFLNRCELSVGAQTYKGDIEHRIRQSDETPVPVAFQDCLDGAKGEYITPLADDDWLAPHACEVLSNLLADGVDVAVAKTVITNPRGPRITDLGGAIMWRKDLTDRIGGFDPRWKHACDTDLYARMLESGAKFCHIPEPLYFQTEHAQHNSYLHRGELAEELGELAKLYPRAMEQLERLVA